MTSDKVTPDQLRRRAIVYVRQSTVIQVLHNLESQRRQYNLAEYARELGFYRCGYYRRGPGQIWIRPGRTPRVPAASRGGLCRPSRRHPVY